MKTLKGTIMLVEHSQNLRSVLKDYFEILDYKVIDFSNGESAIKGFGQTRFDICILDVIMENKDGFTVMQELRKIDPEIPVIFLTAKAEKEDRIKGFKLGCDDYVAKPFSTEELALRVEAIIRRTKKQPLGAKNLYEERIYKFGDFVFNYSSMELNHPANSRNLTRKEAELLKLLCEHENKLLPREVILREIWGEDDFSVGRSMDVFLTKLRSYINVVPIPKEHFIPQGSRRNKYIPGLEPKVEILNVHGTGFMLKVRE